MAAIKYASPIDLGGLELQNFLVQNLGTLPDPAVKGMLVFLTTTNQLQYYDGADWVVISNAGDTGGTPSGPAGGDLSGSYPNPQIAAGTIENADISSSAAIALTKLATNPLDRANHTGTQAASTISDLSSKSLSFFATPSSDLSMNTHKVTNVTDPTGAQDAATKNYVDKKSFSMLLSTSSTSYTVTHNLGTVDVSVTVRDASTGAQVMVDNAATSTSVVTLTFAVAPSANAYRVTVQA